uniref:Transmembrane protein 234 homolog n=1 Tax=Steinernema glaseri TaxID=37863 RepID=A0A1I7ZT95_9BILA
MDAQAASGSNTAISALDFLAITVVSMMWGATNPFLRKGAQHSDANSSVECRWKIMKPLMDLKNLVMNWRFFVPFALNQSASVLFVVLLAHMPLTVVVPCVNALTFVFTAVVGQLVGEEKIRPETLLGTALIVAGIALTLVS